MKKLFLLFVFISFNTQLVLSQPPGFTLIPGAIDCGSTQVLCDIDSTYNSLNSVLNPNVPVSFCGVGSVGNNAKWHVFYAGSSYVKLDIKAENCTFVNNGTDFQEGMQIVPFASDDCLTFTNVGPCESSGGQPKSHYIIEAFDLTPGFCYYLLVDGWAGSVCDYEITLLEGSTMPPPLEFNEIAVLQYGTLTTGCPITFTVDEKGNCVNTNWTTTGGEMNDGQYMANIVFEIGGEYTICFSAEYDAVDCQDSIQVCKTVNIEELENNCSIENIVTSINSCEEDSFDITFDFDHFNESFSGFNIKTIDVDYGNFDYEDLPVTISGLYADCQKDYYFIITDNENSCCQNYADLENVCCYTCDLTNLEVNLDSLVADSLLLSIDFEYSVPDSFMFNLYLDSLDIQLSFYELPYILKIPCSDSPIITIEPVLFSDCVLMDTIDVLCSDSLINNMSYFIQYIDDNSYELFLNYNLTNNSNPITDKSACTISIFLNDVLHSTVDGDEDVTNMSLGVYDCGSLDFVKISLVNSCQPFNEYILVVPPEDIACIVAVGNIYTHNIIIHLNASSNYLYINNLMKSVTIDQVRVIDVQGKTILINNENIVDKIDVSTLFAGVYFVHLYLSDGSYFTKKIAKME